ncbi:MAG: hypothetical protein AAF696_33640, partial [Bacteroidota bacterium]
MAVALMSWAAIDLFKILRETLFTEHIFQSKLLSLLNNACLLASLAYFEHGFNSWKIRLPFFRNPNQWMLSLFLFNIFLITAYLLVWELENQASIYLLHIFDIAYSAFCLALFSYGLCYTFYKRKFGIPFVIFASALMVFVLSGQLAYFPGLVSADSSLPIYIILISHLGLVCILLVFAQNQVWGLKETTYLNLIAEKDMALLAEIAKEQGQHTQKARTTAVPTQHNHLESGCYIKFYRQENLLVLELTLVSKGIIGAKVFSKLKREYRDLLKFAFFKKQDIEVKAYGGIHKDFGGDIYKSVSDIRKKFLNPALIDMGYKELETNELIIQKAKGSGIYELN